MPKIKENEALSDPWFALYMSGDEARNLPYTEKSEVYSLGCTGYLMLAGRPPFTEGSALDIKNSHALKLPPRISTLKFDTKRPSELDEIIEKCLEKDSRDRFDSIAKFQERLEVFPRRIQMKIDAALAARKRAKIIRVALVVAVTAIICAGGAIALMHR
jgi:serine/threonine protein kinase